MRKSIILIMASAIIFASCKKEESNKKGSVNLSFNHTVGAEELQFDNKKYSTSQGHVYEVRNLEYFISNLTFKKSDGEEIVVSQPIYVNAENPTFLSKSDLVQLEEGVYTSVGLTFGIDSTQNVSNTLSSPEEIDMAWPDGMMGGGYHYMKFEGTYDSIGDPLINNPFNLHTGGSMANDLSFDVTFPNSAFTVDEDGINIVISMDLNQWLVTPNTYDFAEFGPAIMMNLDAQNLLRANGASVFFVSIE